MSNLINDWKKLLNLDDFQETKSSSDNLIPSEPINSFTKIKKIDNFLPDDLYGKLLLEMSRQKFIGGWLSNETTDPHGHWNCNFVSNDKSANLADKSGEFNNPVVQEVWNWIKENVPEFKDKILLRCYMNAHTYGVDGYFHTDSSRDNEKTMVLYIVSGDWNKNWGGETIFQENDELIFSVLPKKNRSIVFNSNLSHCARGVSRLFHGIRKTFMIKVRDRRTDNFEKLSSFLIKYKAHLKDHQNGSLHDHLVRSFQLLEDKRAPEHVCFAAGLHSIFGTNVYKDGILELKNKDIIVSEFGEQAFELAALFSIINRPSTLETPETFQDGKFHLKLNSDKLVAVEPETLENLYLIEGANLTDQKQLDPEKFPTIYKFYTDYGQNV